MSGITYDPEKFQLTIARLKKGGHVFEIAVDQDLALAYHGGKQVDLKDILQYEFIFADAQKGQKASEKVLSDIFGSDDPLVIADTILKNGEIHFTVKFLKELREKKKRALIQRIHQYGVDPRTKAPHTLVRIEAALEEAKVHVDEHKSVEEQAEAAIKKMRPILPMSFEKRKAEIIIPAHYAGKSYGSVQRYVSKEQWGSDGSYHAHIEVPAGLYQEVIDQLSRVTNGEIQVNNHES